MVVPKHEPPASLNQPPVGPVGVLSKALDAYRQAAASPGANNLTRFKLGLAIVALETQAVRLAETAKVLEAVAALLGRRPGPRVTFSPAVVSVRAGIDALAGPAGLTND